MNRLLESVGILITRDIKRRIRQNQIKPSSKNSGTTLVKSSKLVNSIRHQVHGDQITIGSNLPYAKIHHYGGVIHPRHAKYLAIPLTKEAAARRPRDFANTFIKKGIIFRKQEGGKLEALYVLKKSVTMPARPWLSVPEGSFPAISQLLKDFVDKNLSKG